VGRVKDERLEPSCGGLAHAREHVLVGALRERGGVVTEPLLDHLRGLAGGQQEARVRVAQILQRPDPRQTGLADQLGEAVGGVRGTTSVGSTITRFARE
jgi:hypothetical protein